MTDSQVDALVRILDRYVSVHEQQLAITRQEIAKRDARELRAEELQARSVAAQEKQAAMFHGKLTARVEHFTKEPGAKAVE